MTFIGKVFAKMIGNFIGLQIKTKYKILAVFGDSETLQFFAVKVSLYIDILVTVRFVNGLRLKKR